MVQKFSDWRLDEAKTTKDDNFDRIVMNIGDWLGDALDPTQPDSTDGPKRANKISAMLSRNPKFQEYERENQFSMASDPRLVRMKLVDLGQFLNEMPKRDSDKFLADLRAASGAWRWHKLTADPNRVPGKRGRPPGSKNKPKASPPAPAQEAPAPVPGDDTLEVRSPVTAGSLARALGVKKSDIVAACDKLGYDARRDFALDSEEGLVEILAGEHGRGKVRILPSHQAQVDRLGGQAGERKGRMAQLVDAIAARESQMDDLLREIKSLNRERDALEDEVRAMEEEIRALEDRMQAQRPAPAPVRTRRKRVKPTFSFDESVRPFGDWARTNY